MNVPINIYAELTPNPNSMKFVANIMLLEGGAIEYNSKAEAINCPLALQLFEFSGITKVFITSNFVTLSKEGSVDWFEITNILREFIRRFLMSGDHLFIGSPFAENHIPTGVKKVIAITAEATEAKPTPNNDEFISDPETEKKIIELLDEFVRPAVEGDGGAIDFRSYHNGVVSVVLKGACSGCPSATVTLKSGIENLLKRMIPGVTEVVAVKE